MQILGSKMTPFPLHTIYLSDLEKKTKSFSHYQERLTFRIPLPLTFLNHIANLFCQKTQKSATWFLGFKSIPPPPPPFGTKYWNHQRLKGGRLTRKRKITGGAQQQASGSSPQSRPQLPPPDIRSDASAGMLPHQNPHKDHQLLFNRQIIWNQNFGSQTSSPERESGFQHWAVSP